MGRLVGGNPIASGGRHEGVGGGEGLHLGALHKQIPISTTNKSTQHPHIKSASKIKSTSKEAI